MKNKEKYFKFIINDLIRKTEYHFDEDQKRANIKFPVMESYPHISPYETPFYISYHYDSINRFLKGEWHWSQYDHEYLERSYSLTNKLDREKVWFEYLQQFCGSILLDFK